MRGEVWPKVCVVVDVCSIGSTAARGAKASANARRTFTWGEAAARQRGLHHTLRHARLQETSSDRK